MQLADAIRRHDAATRRKLICCGVPSRDIDDVLQSVMLVFARRFDAIDERAQRSFLQETARRAASDYRRRRWNRVRFVELGDDTLDLAAPSMRSGVELEQSHRLVRDALQALPDAERNVFVLSNWEHLSRSKIASRLGIPEGTVASQLLRASRMHRNAYARLTQEPVPSASELGTLASMPWHAPGRTFDCVVLPQAWTSRTLGPYCYRNDQWGRAKATSGYDQCLLQRHSSGAFEWGWTWNWPGVDSHGFGQPGVVYGWKPWAGGHPTDPRFPLRVSRVEQLHIDYAVEQTGVGRHQLLLMFWLLHSPTRSFEPDPYLISRELVVKLCCSEELGDCHVSRPVRIGNETYDLWLDSDSKEVRLEPWPAWVMHKREGCTEGRFDAKAMLDLLTNLGGVSPNDWIGSIDFGNAVLGGSGTTWVKKFEIHCTTR